MLIKIHKSYRDVVAICDKELLGKKFEENEFQLDVKENFFNGEETSEQDCIKKIQNMKREDATFNIIGKKSTQTAVKAGLINSSSINTIAQIPFVLVLI